MRNQLVGEGSMAPKFALSSPEGSVRLVDYAGRRNVLLYFVCGFTCSRCWHWLLALEQAWRGLPTHDTAVLVIGSERHLKPAAQLAADLGLSFTFLADKQGHVARRYGLASSGRGRHGAAFFVDKQGVVNHVQNMDRRHRVPDMAALLAATARQTIAFALGSRARSGGYSPSAVPCCR